MKIKVKVNNKKAKVFFRFALPFYFLCFFSISLFAQTSTEFLLLAEKIRNGSVEEKRDILFQINKLQTEQASRLAIPALKDESEIVRATATNSVIFLPPNEAAQVLFPLLQDKSIFVRRETAYALGKVRNPQTINSLLQVFQKEKVIEVRSAIIIALGQIGDVSAVDFLTKILQMSPKRNEEFLRRSAARSIGQIAKFIQTQKIQVITPTNFLPENYYEIEKPLFKNLIQAFPDFRFATSVLIKIPQNPKESSDIRREAAFALGEIADDSAITILQTNLDSDDVYLAEISKQALQKIKIYAEFKNSK